MFFPDPQNTQIGKNPLSARHYDYAIYNIHIIPSIILIGSKEYIDNVQLDAERYSRARQKRYILGLNHKHICS